MNKKNLPIIIGVAVVLVLAIVLGVVFLGGEGTTTTTTTTTKKPNPTPAELDYKLGMGVVVSTASSKTGTAQVDATVATVVLDKDGKIVLCRLDVAQNKMTVTDGTIELDKTFETKMELGDRYGMGGKPYSPDNNGDGVVYEWDYQAKEFEKYVVGKTAAEVAAMTTQVVNDHNISTDNALLTAGCTIDIVAFRDAVVKACNDDQGVSFKAKAGTFTLGVAANTTVDESSKAATADEAGSVNMYSDFAATVVSGGKILASLNDAIQPKIAINAAGEIGDTTYNGTKRELKEGYNMATFGANLDNNGDGKVLEYYIQSAAFSAHIVGMTGAEVAAMETAPATQGSVGYMISTDAELLAAGCTIQIGSICEVVAKSVTNAR